jgi:hypothetical protein
MHRAHAILGLAFAWIFFSASGAFADTITVTDLSQDPLTGVFQYTVSISNSAVVDSGDGFVIYDFPDYESSTLDVNDFSAPVETLTGNDINATPGPLVPNALDAGLVTVLGLTDNPTIDNLSFVYTGPTIPIGNATTGILTVQSSLDGSGVTVGTSGVASKDSGGPKSQEYYFGYVSVPMSSTNAVTSSAVPFPSTVWGGGLLLVIFGASRVFSKSRRDRLFA